MSRALVSETLLPQKSDDPQAPKWQAWFGPSGGLPDSQPLARNREIGGEIWGFEAHPKLGALLQLPPGSEDFARPGIAATAAFAEAGPAGRSATAVSDQDAVSGLAGNARFHLCLCSNAPMRHLDTAAFTTCRF